MEHNAHYTYFTYQSTPTAFLNPIRRNTNDSSLFLEPAADDVVTFFEGYDERHFNSLQKQYRQKRVSLYGYTWRGIVRARVREFGIAGMAATLLETSNKE